MKKCLGVLVGILMALVFTVNLVSATVILQQLQIDSLHRIGGDNTTNKVGQSIKSETDLSGLREVTLKLAKEDYPTGTFRVSIQTSTNPSGGGFPNGTVLGYAIKNFSEIANYRSPAQNNQNYKFVLDEFINLSANTEYWIVIEFWNPPSSWSYLNFGDHLYNPYPNGRVVYYSGGAWTTYWGAEQDMYFILERPAQPSLKLPLPSGISSQCIQGVNGSTSHQANNTKYDLDLDTSNDSDEDVVAAASGTAYLHADAGPNSFGNHITIDHGNGYFTLYAHLKSFSVTNGQTVSQGQIIGKEGCTGYCFGDHLHFGLHGGNATLDALGSVSVLAERITARDVTAGGLFVEIKSDEFICALPGGHFYESNNTAP